LQKYNSQEKNLFFSEVLHECNTPVFYNIKPKLNLSTIFFRLEQRTCKSPSSSLGHHNISMAKKIFMVKVFQEKGFGMKKVRSQLIKKQEKST
jgi:hypothetical protein